MPCARSIAAAGLAHLACSPGSRSWPAKSNGMAMKWVISLMVSSGIFVSGNTLTAPMALSWINLRMRRDCVGSMVPFHIG